MELKSLLQNSHWEDSEIDFSKMAISKNTDVRVSRDIKVLVNNNYKAILLNFLFLSITIYVYLQNQSISFLIPSILIASCFLFLAINVMTGAKSLNKIDYSTSMRQVLTEVLESTKTMHKRQCRYHSVLMTASFLGGFFLGLAYQGWTVETTIEKPVIFMVVGPLTFGFYYFSKSKYFKSFNRSLNPGYVRAKMYLEEQLRLLNEEG